MNKSTRPFSFANPSFLPAALAAAMMIASSRSASAEPAPAAQTSGGTSRRTKTCSGDRIDGLVRVAHRRLLSSPLILDVEPQGVADMISGDHELEELRRRLARVELLLASVEFDKSFWGRVLRLLSVAIISFVVVLSCGLLGIGP